MMSGEASKVPRREMASTVKRAHAHAMHAHAMHAHAMASSALCVNRHKK